MIRITGRVENQAAVIRMLDNASRRAHGALAKAVGETTRTVQQQIRNEVNSVFGPTKRGSPIGNAIRSVVYDNLRNMQRGATRGRPYIVPSSKHTDDVAGIIFSKFGRREGAGFVDYLAPYLTGRAILPQRGRYLAIPLQEGKRNRRPTASMNLQPVKLGSRLFLVKRTRRKTTFMFLLVEKVQVRRRLRIGQLMGGAKGRLTSAIVRNYLAAA